MCAVKDFTATHAEGDMCGERLHGTCGDMWSKKERADPTASALHALPRGNPLSVPRKLARTLYIVFIP